MPIMRIKGSKWPLIQSYFCVYTYPNVHLLTFLILTCCCCIMLCLWSTSVFKSFLMKNATKVTPNDIAGQNNHLSWYYCVQHIMVFRKKLHPHLPKCSFVHLSHIKVLYLYHAALANHLSLSTDTWQGNSIRYSEVCIAVCYMLCFLDLIFMVDLVCKICNISHFSITYVFFLYW